jgi:hypothetical protein
MGENFISKINAGGKLYSIKLDNTLEFQDSEGNIQYSYDGSEKVSIQIAPIDPDKISLILTAFDNIGCGSGGESGQGISDALLEETENEE